jgi:hypothetical protein
LAKELHCTKLYIDDLLRAERLLEAKSNRRSGDASPGLVIRTLSKTFDTREVELSGFFYESSNSDEAFDGVSIPDRFKPPATGKKPSLPSLDFTKIRTNPKNVTDSNLARIQKSKYALMIENQIDKLEERLGRDRAIADEISFEVMDVREANAALDSENDELLKQIRGNREKFRAIQAFVR